MSAKARTHFVDLQTTLVKFSSETKSVDAFKKLSASVKLSSTGLDAAREKSRALLMQIKQTPKPTKKMRNEYDRARRAVERLTERHAKERQALSRARTSMRSHGIGLKNQQSRYEAAANATKKYHRELRDLTQLQANATASANKHHRSLERSAHVSLVAGSMTRVGTGMIRAVTEPFEVAVSIEKALTDVDKFIANLDTKQAKINIQAMSVDGAMSFEDVAGIMSYGGQIGLDVSGAEAFTRMVQKLSSAWSMEVSESIERLKTIRSTMHLDVAGVDRLADTINYVGDLTDAGPGDIATILAQSGSVALTAGFSDIEAVGLAAIFREQSKSAELASTAMKNTVVNLNAGDAMPDKRRNVLEELGFDALDLASRSQADAVGTLREVFAAIAAVDPSRRGSVVEQVVGRDAVAPVSGIVLKLEKFDRVLGLATDTIAASGSAEREDQRSRATTDFRRRQALTSWRNTLGSMGDALIPAATQLILGLIPIIEGLNDWVKEWPRLSQIVLTGIAVLGAGLLVLAPVIVAACAVITSGLWAFNRWANFKVSKATKGSLSGKSKPSILRRGVGAMGGKIGVAAAGLAAVDAVFTLASDKSAGEKTAAIMSTAGGVAGAIGGAKAGAAMGFALGSVVPIVGNAAGTLVGTVLGSSIGYFAGSGMGDWIGGGIGNVVDWFGNDDDAPLMLDDAGSVSPKIGTIDRSDHSDNSIHVSVTAAAGTASEDLAKQIASEVARVRAHQTDGAALYDVPNFAFD